MTPDGKTLSIEEQLFQAKFDAKRWKDIAIYLLDCHAATAYEEGMRAKTSKSKRNRFVSILRKGIDYLRGNDRPYMGPGYSSKTPEERVIERSESAIRDLETMNQI